MRRAAVALFLTPSPSGPDPRSATGREGHPAVRAAGKPLTANFDYAGPLTEWVLLGVLANRYPKRKLAWNAGELKITNDEEPNAIVRRTYRKGWEVDRL